MVSEAIKSRRMPSGAVVILLGCHYEAVTLYIAVMMSMLKDALLQLISVAYKCSRLIYTPTVPTVPYGFLYDRPYQIPLCLMLTLTITLS